MIKAIIIGTSLIISTIIAAEYYSHSQKVALISDVAQKRCAGVGTHTNADQENLVCYANSLSELSFIYKIYSYNYEYIDEMNKEDELRRENNQ